MVFKYYKTVEINFTIKYFQIQRISDSETELFNQLEVFKQQRQLLIQENKRLRSIMNDKKLSIHESDTSSAYSNDISVSLK